MLKELKVEDVKCIDDGHTKGVIILCGKNSLVSLIFKDSVDHKETDDLVHSLWSKVGLHTVIVRGNDFPHE
jgi:hypothetical protein